MADTCRIVVMASGNGSNFQALIDAVASGKIPSSKIIRLYVNRSKAYATQRAEQAGIPWEYFNLISNGFQAKGEKDPEKLQEARDRYDAALAERLLRGEESTPDLVVLAGWMYVFGKAFLDPLEARGIRIINLHPALPGMLLPPCNKDGRCVCVLMRKQERMTALMPLSGRSTTTRPASWPMTPRASWCTTSSARWTGASPSW